MGLITNDKCPCKRHRKKRRRPCDDGSRDYSDADTVQKCLEPPETRRVKERYFPRAFGANMAVPTP